MTTAGMATIPSREGTLERVLDAIVPQVDMMFLVLNYGEEEAPQFLDKYSNLFWVVSNGALGDANKFWGLTYAKDYYLALDDDLVVPEGYVAKMIDGVDRYDGLVSLHARVYPPQPISFKQWKANYRCLGTVTDDYYVNFVGSGCCAFNVNRLKLSLSDFKRPNMADIFLSEQATLQGVPMVVLAHEEGYLTYTHPQGDTIWKNTKEYSYHLKVLQSFIK